jgi:hypothetical protein
MKGSFALKECNPRAKKTVSKISALVLFDPPLPGKICRVVGRI